MDLIKFTTNQLQIKNITMLKKFEELFNNTNQFYRSSPKKSENLRICLVDRINQIFRIVLKLIECFGMLISSPEFHLIKL